MGDGDPDAADLRSERCGQAGVPVHRGEEQLVERAFHGRNSTTKVRGLCGTTVPFTWRMVAVTITESELGPAAAGRARRNAGGRAREHGVIGH